MRVGRFLLTSTIVMAALALAGAHPLGWPPTVPGLPRSPQVDPSSFAPGVREQVEEALAAVRAEEGFEVLQEAASLRPEYAPLWIELGDLLLAQGDSTEAILYYRTALKHDPQSAIGHYGLGQAIKARGQTGVAAEEYRQALAPRFGAAHYALALAARDLGKEEQARGTSASTRATSRRALPPATR